VFVGGRFVIRGNVLVIGGKALVIGESLFVIGDSRFVIGGRVLVIGARRLVIQGGFCGGRFVMRFDCAIASKGSAVTRPAIKHAWALVRDKIFITVKEVGYSSQGRGRVSMG
jgi:hypothetical protein